MKLLSAELNQWDVKIGSCKGLLSFVSILFIKSSITTATASKHNNYCMRLSQLRFWILNYISSYIIHLKIITVHDFVLNSLHFLFWHKRWITDVVFWPWNTTLFVFIGEGDKESTTHWEWLVDTWDSWGIKRFQNRRCFVWTGFIPYSSQVSTYHMKVWWNLIVWSRKKILQSSMKSYYWIDQHIISIASCKTDTLSTSGVLNLKWVLFLAVYW